GAGVTVELTTDGEHQELPSSLESSAYRIIQEALTNTLRHAGASRATVALHYEPNALSLEVVDDGNAPAASNGASGRGLIGMRERAAAFGGTVETVRIDSGGFRVAARLPFASVVE